MSLFSMSAGAYSPINSAAKGTLAINAIKTNCVTSTSTCLPDFEFDYEHCTCVPKTKRQEPAANNESALNAALNQCQSDSAAAAAACNQETDAGVQSAQATLTNFTVQASQMGIAGACGGLAAAIAGANAAVIYFSQNCSSKRTACMTSCDQADTMAGPYNTTMAGSAYKTCKKYDTQINQANQAVHNMVNTAQNAARCSEETDTAMLDFCKSNPKAIGCESAATDCSNPQIAASNPICICKNNPSSESCTGALAKAGDFSGGSYDASSNTTTTMAKSGGLDTDGMIGGVGFEGNGMKPDGGRAEDVGGAKGGRPLMDGGGGSGFGGGGGQGGGGSASSTAVNAGFRGGGGGGGWGSGGGSGGGRGNYAENADRAAKAGPNLRDFLPSGKMDPKLGNRGLAGVSGPDGITGPHSDIWKKIQNRYQIQVERAKLIP